MSLVRPSFSQTFLNRRIICSAVSLPRLLTLIMKLSLSDFYIYDQNRPSAARRTKAQSRHVASGIQECKHRLDNVQGESGLPSVRCQQVIIEPVPDQAVQVERIPGPIDLVSPAAVGNAAYLSASNQDLARRGQF